MHRYADIAGFQQHVHGVGRHHDVVGKRQHAGTRILAIANAVPNLHIQSQRVFADDFAQFVWRAPSAGHTGRLARPVGFTVLAQGLGAWAYASAASLLVAHRHGRRRARASGRSNGRCIGSQGTGAARGLGLSPVISVYTLV